MSTPTRKFKNKEGKIYLIGWLKVISIGMINKKATIVIIIMMSHINLTEENGEITGIMLKNCKPI